MSQVFNPSSGGDVEKLTQEYYVPITGPVVGILTGYPVTFTSYSAAQNLPEVNAYADGSRGYVGITDGNVARLGTGLVQIAGESVEMLAARCSDALTIANTGDPLYLVSLATVSLTRLANSDPLMGVISEVDAGTGNFKVIIEQGDGAGGGGGGMTDFIITDGITPQTIANGDTITFAAGTFLLPVTSAVDTVTTDLSATGVPSATTFLRGDNVWATPAGGGTTVPSGTVTGTILKWDGAAWIETTSATGQILVSADNAFTIDDGLTTVADITMTANDGTSNPSFVLRGAGGGAPQLSISNLAGSGGYQILNTQAFAINSGQSIAIGSSANGGTLQFPTGTSGQIVQSGSTDAAVGGDVGLVTTGKDFLSAGDLPAFYQETAQNAEGRWCTWVGGDAIAISPTVPNVGSAVNVDLGSAAPDQQTFSASWPFYRFDVYYVNTTDATNEHMTITLLHDGLTTNEMEYGWIGTTASREMEYVVTVGAELELGLWSNTTGKSVKFYIRGVAGGGMN